MRKILLAALAAAVLMPAGANAQSASQREFEAFRDANEALFTVPAYEAPRGQRYRRVSVGETLVPAFFADKYVIENFREYRLSPPAREQKYIRFGNDVVLVNTRSGNILAVHRAFFETE